MNVPIRDQLQQSIRKITATLEHNRWPNKSLSAQSRLVSIYAATIAVNFTDWMGKTLSQVRSKASRFALEDNLRCETQQNHTDMLRSFAISCGVTFDGADYDYASIEVARIRDLLSHKVTGGLAGLTIITVLENTSTVFIPVLERVALNLDAIDTRYTRVHGEADMEHSRSFLAALKSELRISYPPIKKQRAIRDAFSLTDALLGRIFS